MTGFLSEYELAAQSILLRYAMVIISLTFSLSTVPITHMGRAAGQAEHMIQNPDSDNSARGSMQDSIQAFPEEPRRSSEDGSIGSIQTGADERRPREGLLKLRGRAAFLLFFKATLNIYLVISVIVILLLTVFRTALAELSTSVTSVAHLVDSLTPYVVIFVVLQIVWQALCSVAFSRSIIFSTFDVNMCSSYRENYIRSNQICFIYTQTLSVLRSCERACSHLASGRLSGGHSIGGATHVPHAVPTIGLLRRTHRRSLHQGIHLISVSRVS